MKRKLISLIAIGAAWLAACSSGPVAPPVDDATLAAEARAAVARGDILGARSAYEQLLTRTADDTRRNYLIELARAEIRLGVPEAALTRLDNIVPPYSDALRAEVMAVRADALFALGRTSEAVRVLVDREIWLNTPTAILDNQARIWNGIAAAPQQNAEPPSGDATIDGWLALAPLTGLTADGPAFIAALIEWRDAFPNHPAAAGILAEQLAALRGDSARPGMIALLLPLGAGGELRLQAEAIREGFFAASLSTDRESAPDIRIFDTSGGNAIAAYRSAQLAGADFIVGPLLADPSVRDVLTEAGLIPTLALNVAPEGSRVPANFFQFALSSDDEIDAIATQAIADGHETAVILHYRDTRGRRLRDSFAAAFESRGGRIIAARDYPDETGDLVAPIEDLLGITQSAAREERLRANLGGRAIEFEPRRRDDIDMIFLQVAPGSGPQDARLLVPLLEGSNAVDIPTYASSDVFDPAQSRSNADLDGLIIPDLPMLIDPIGDARTAFDLLDGFTSRSAAFNRRLFAFGYDAYRLAELLFAGDSSDWPYPGATGRLVRLDNGRIRRILPLAEFNGGQLRALAPGINLLGQR
jgi:outer membrane PBP1 activator LpoA protein